MPHTAKLWMRIRGRMARLAVRAIVIAKATRQRTAERPRRSAMIHTPMQVTNSNRLPPSVPVTNGMTRAEQLGEHDAEQHPARRRQAQLQRQSSVHPAMALERDGGAEQEQRGRIVQQALALEHVDRAARHADAAQNGGRGSRIGRSDDRAERQRGIRAAARPSRRRATRPRRRSAGRPRPRARTRAATAAEPRPRGSRTPHRPATGAMKRARAVCGSRSMRGAPGTSASTTPAAASMVG